MNLEMMNQELSTLNPQMIVQWAVQRAGKPVLTTNFGPHELPLSIWQPRSSLDIRSLD